MKHSSTFVIQLLIALWNKKKTILPLVRCISFGIQMGVPFPSLQGQVP